MDYKFIKEEDYSELSPTQAWIEFYEMFRKKLKDCKSESEENLLFYRYRNELTALKHLMNIGLIAKNKGA